MASDAVELRSNTYRFGCIDVRTEGDHPDRCPYCYGHADDVDLDHEAMLEFVEQNDDAVLYFNQPDESIEWYADYVDREGLICWELVPGHDDGPGDEGDTEYIADAMTLYDDVRVLDRDHLEDRIVDRLDRRMNPV